MLKRSIGDIGEKAVCKEYRKKGYSILERNYLSKYGEIDIIVQKKDVMAFVEVKARNSNSIANPREFVTPSKIDKIIKTAKIYMLYKNIDDVNIRFDVAEVYHTDKFKVISIDIIENAFTL